MLDNKLLSDKQKTCDQCSSSPSLSYPDYLDHVKIYLQENFPFHTVNILTKPNQSPFEFQSDSGQFFILLTCQKLHRGKYQLLTQSFMNESAYSFYVKHLVTLNHLQLKIQDSLSASVIMNFCNKINKIMENFRLIIDPVCGKIYFQTKSFINQKALFHLKKNLPKNDCLYTEIISTSTKKAQKYIDILLYLLGQIQLKELVANQKITSEFSFLKQSLDILEGLQKCLFCVSFLSLQENKNQFDYSKIVDKTLFNKYKQNQYPKYKGNTDHKFRENAELQKSKQLNQKTQLQLQNLKSTILNSSLQYFSKNSQKIFHLFNPKHLYSNTDFTILQTFNFSKKNYFLPNSIPQNQTPSIFDKFNQPKSKSSVHNKKILSYIQIIEVQECTFSGENNCYEWRVISEGGFGVIELGIIRYRNLSIDLKSTQEDFSSTIRQKVTRKKDKNPKKMKIKRERKILKMLEGYTHSNINNFYISFQIEFQDCIFSDFTPNMSFDVYLKKNSYSISFNHKLTFMAQAIQALGFLHNHNIIHLDIKPGNMLINKRLKLLVSDFGEAFVYGKDNPVTHSHAYTVPYCAPEIFNQPPKLTEKVDIYAIGVCILKAVLGENFLQTFLRKKIAKRFHLNNIVNFGIGEKFQKSFLYPLIKVIYFIGYKCLSEDANKRPQLSWIGQIVEQCRKFIYSLIY